MKPWPFAGAHLFERSYSAQMSVRIHFSFHLLIKLIMAQVRIFAAFYDLQYDSEAMAATGRDPTGGA